MRRVCQAVALALRTFAASRITGREVHELTYLAQKLLSLNLGYRFAWLASGPRSRALATELREYAEACVESAVSDPKVEAAARRLKSLIEEVVRATGLPPQKALNLVSSYVMLANDVYPRPEDVVSEVLRVRTWARRRDVEAVAAAVSKLLKAGRAVGAGAR